MYTGVSISPTKQELEGELGRMEPLRGESKGYKRIHKDCSRRVSVVWRPCLQRGMCQFIRIDHQNTPLARKALISPSYTFLSVNHRRSARKRKYFLKNFFPSFLVWERNGGVDREMRETHPCSKGYRRMPFDLLRFHHQ